MSATSATIQELLRQTRQAFQLPIQPGTDVRGPLFAICFGGGASALNTRLRYFWPDAEENIKNINAVPCVNCLNIYSESGNDSDRIFRLIADDISPSQDLNNNNLNLVWFLDAAGIRDIKELNTWLDIKNQLREKLELNFKNFKISELEILLTDDVSAVFGGKTADKLRREFIRRGEEKYHPVFLIGARRGDDYINLFAGDAENVSEREYARDLSGDISRLGRGVAPLYNAAAALLAVWNSPERPDLTPGFYTLGYSRAERPVESVSRLCVLALLGELSREDPDWDFSRDALRNRLGLQDKNSVLPFLESYLADAVERFAPFRPELFPRANPDAKNGVPEDMTAKEFNELTFGTWNAWLADSIGAARESLRHDLPGAKRWREEFANILREKFTIRERAFLAGNADKTARMFLSGQIPSGDLPLKAYTEAWLQSLLATARELNASLADVIRQEGEPARIFLSLWQDLLRSAPTPPAIQPDSGFGLDSYQEALQAYFMQNGPALREKLWHMDREKKISKEDMTKGDAGLEIFLKQALNNLLADETLRLAMGADLAGEWEFRMKSGPDEAMSALARTLCEISARLPSGTAEPFGIVFLAGPDQPLRDFIEYALRPAKRDSENKDKDADINNNINGDSDGENITSPVENENKNENETENKNETETKVIKEIKEIKNEKSEEQRFYNIYNTGRTETAEVLAFYRIEPEKI